jgi:hypothetical protein
MSRWRTPRWARASTTLLTTAALAAMVPASPMPFTPRVFTGERVTVYAVSKPGVWGPREERAHRRRDVAKKGPSSSPAQAERTREPAEFDDVTGA